MFDTEDRTIADKFSSFRTSFPILFQGKLVTSDTPFNGGTITFTCGVTQSDRPKPEKGKDGWPRSDQRD